MFDWLGSNPVQNLSLLVGGVIATIMGIRAQLKKSNDAHSTDPHAHLAVRMKSLEDGISSIEHDLSHISIGVEKTLDTIAVFQLDNRATGDSLRRIEHRTDRIDTNVEILKSRN